MNVTFYNFAKKENSTATPAAGSGTLKTCYWKTPGSIQAPVIELESATLPGYNYCYIQETNRYYFITGTSYNAGVWELSLRVDVLASFKSDIGGTSMYVERASAEKNGNLIDRLYPVTNASTSSSTLFKNQSTFAGGAFIVNVANGNANSGTSSYVMSNNGFASFLDSIMVNGNNSTSVWDSVSQSIDISVYDPLRYINSVYWFPDSYSSYASGQQVTQMYLGNFIASTTAYAVTQSLSTLTRSYTITLPKHPQASARGSFCNMTPFTEYTLNLGPFGAINLDGAAVANATSVTVDVYQDVNTGQGRAIIKTAGGNELANVVCQWGVPLKIFSGANVSIGNIIQTTSGLAGMIAGAATGGVGAMIAGATSLIGGVEDMAKGTVSSTGSQGAATDHLMPWTLDAKFYTIANDDNANNGRPLCAVRTPAALGGYIKAQKGLVQSANASRTELDSINAYMEGGFYYE